MSVDRKDAELIDNTPPSIAYDPKTQSITYAWDRQAWEVIDAIDECILLPNLHKITNSRLIDLLAWQLHVDFYDRNAPLELRRELVRKSLEWHTLKGTLWVVRDILQTVFKEGTVLEWFEYNPKPHADWHDAYKFKIVLSTNTGTDPTLLRRVIDAIDSVKPVSRWIDEFVIARPSYLYLWTGFVSIKRVTNRIYLMQIPTEVETNVYVGVAVAFYRITTIPAPPY